MGRSSNGHFEALDDSRLTPEDRALLRGFGLALRGGWQDGVGSPKTIKAYEFAAKRFLVWVRGRVNTPVHGLARDALLEYMAELRETLRPASARLYFVGLRLFWRWLREEDEVKDDITLRIRPPKLDRRELPAYTRGEVRAIFKYLETRKRTLIGLRDLALCHLLLDTGLRRKEVAALRTQDVSWQHNRIAVLGKGNKQRQVRVSATTQRHLDKYLRARNRVYPECEWLFHARGGAPLSPDGISALHDRIERAVGFHCHPHKWRHTAAQAMLDSGMEREYVRLVLGHEDEETLKVYVRQTDAARALEALKKASPVERLLT